MNLNNWVIIHRGLLNNKLIENSFKAIKETIDNNMMCEFDIHISKDNKVFIFHDDNLKRMCKIDKYTKDLNYDEIKKYKLLNSNEHIPLLEDVLKYINGKVLIDIELKYDNLNHNLENETIKLLKNYKGKFILKSFHPSIVKYLKKIRKKENMNFKIGMLIKNRTALIYSMIFIRPDFISYNYKLANKWIFKICSKFKPTILYTFKNNDRYNDYKFGKIVENYEDMLD